MFNSCTPNITSLEAEFLDESRTKVLGVFLLAIYGHLYSFALRFLCLQTNATSSVFQKSHNLLCISTVQLLYTVKEEGGKADRKPYPLPYGLRNPYRTLKIMPRNLNEMKSYVHEFGFRY